ncbi:MAG: hypothetical protein L0Y79_06185 [Chlorobi bacterium]|nr:hypothetical protein [Chlorobiota bacterium]MCI0716802.1 hypothetical protein [Chlorobiota bacterium]
MKHLANGSIKTTIVVMIFCFSSCDTVENDEASVRYFHAKTDTLILPDSVSALDTLIAKLKGPLGGSSCFHFSYFEVSSIEKGIKVKVWGKEILNTLCLAILVGFDKDYKIYNLRAGFL